MFFCSFCYIILLFNINLIIYILGVRHTDLVINFEFFLNQGQVFDLLQIISNSSFLPSQLSPE